ncbi:MAG: acyl-CoA thioesterase [Candidatus Melainabacteria bacterium HGW-Melainabacteria-1]|nr:MAG: acyl-CoA thioesterase [Candidatus Melainabacteria bacterium HGW-Melainabacteria-1]
MADTEPPKEEHPIFQQRVANAQTHVVKIVFPNVTNHYDTLFGGTALQWMDEVASIASIRFSRQQTVTVSLDRISFNKPIPSGSFVELVASVASVGTSSMKIQVDLYLERMDQDGRELAISGMFTFVAINAERRPVPVEWNRPLLPT